MFFDRNWELESIQFVSHKSKNFSKIV